MRRTALLIALIGAMVLMYAGGALTQEAPRGVERYIVVFEDEAVADPGQAAEALSRRHELQVGFVYQYALEGFSAVIPNERVAEVRADGRVAYIDRDGTMRAFAQTIPWGIDKIDADASLTSAGNGSGTVSNVNGYVIDSGI